MPFCSTNFRMSSRSLTDIGMIIQIPEMEPLKGSVSWTDKPISYHLHKVHHGWSIENFRVWPSIWKHRSTEESWRGISAASAGTASGKWHWCKVSSLRYYTSQPCTLKAPSKEPETLWRQLFLSQQPILEGHFFLGRWFFLELGGKGFFPSLKLGQYCRWEGGEKHRIMKLILFDIHPW